MYVYICVCLYVYSSVHMFEQKNLYTEEITKMKIKQECELNALRKDMEAVNAQVRLNFSITRQFLQHLKLTKNDVLYVNYKEQNVFYFKLLI